MDRAYEGAASGGQREVIEWLRDKKIEPGYWINFWGDDPHDHNDLYADYLVNSPCSLAAKGGHLALLQWLIDRGCRWYDHYCIESAARRGRLDVVRWLCEVRVPTFHPDDMADPHDLWLNTVSNGHTEVVRWLTAKFTFPTWLWEDLKDWGGSNDKDDKKTYECFLEVLVHDPSLAEWFEEHANVSVYALYEELRNANSMHE